MTSLSSRPVDAATRTETTFDGMRSAAQTAAVTRVPRLAWFELMEGALYGMERTKRSGLPSPAPMRNVRLPNVPHDRRRAEPPE